MALIRCSVQWTTLLKSRATAVARGPAIRQARQGIYRRGYASGGAHGASRASGDLPWAIGAVGVTVPAVYYLLQPGPNTSHVHGHEEMEVHQEDVKSQAEGKQDADEDDKGDEEESVPKDQGQDASQEKLEESGDRADDRSEKNSDDDSDGEDKKHQETPDTSDDDRSDEGGDGRGDKDHPKIHGEKDGNTVMSYPDAKGGVKKRLESKNSVKLGERNDQKPASSKPSGDSHTTMSGAQEGISNTNTKHSVDYGKLDEKSNKSEGAPDTAKIKGPVDPRRPQV